MPKVTDPKIVNALRDHVKDDPRFAGAEKAEALVCTVNGCCFVVGGVQLSAVLDRAAIHLAGVNPRLVCNSDPDEDSTPSYLYATKPACCCADSDGPCNCEACCPNGALATA